MLCFVCLLTKTEAHNFFSHAVNAVARRMVSYFRTDYCFQSIAIRSCPITCQTGTGGRERGI